MNKTVVTMSPNTILLSLEQYEEFKSQKESFDKVLRELKNEEGNCYISISYDHGHGYSFVNITRYSDKEILENYKKMSRDYEVLKDLKKILDRDLEKLKMENSRLKAEIEELKKKKSWFSF